MTKKRDMGTFEKLLMMVLLRAIADYALPASARGEKASARHDARLMFQNREPRLIILCDHLGLDVDYVCECADIYVRSCQKSPLTSKKANRALLCLTGI